MRVGYYVFGTGISAGTTILSVDSGVQITLSGNAGSSGTSNVIVSPWLINTGTIKLPDVSTAGRFRRSRTSSTAIGQLQADQNQAHTHTGTTDAGSAHTHQVTGTSGFQSVNHTHGYTISSFGFTNQVPTGNPGGVVQSSDTTTTESTNHNHQINITSAAESAHTHGYTTSSNGGTEARPLSIVVMTCVKT